MRTCKVEVVRVMGRNSEWQHLSRLLVRQRIRCQQIQLQSTLSWSAPVLGQLLLLLTATLPVISRRDSFICFLMAGVHLQE
jgi:hypothetical protein